MKDWRGEESRGGLMAANVWRRAGEGVRGGVLGFCLYIPVFHQVGFLGPELGYILRGTILRPFTLGPHRWNASPSPYPPNSGP